ncbi:TetR/AcrR family transcriptional regulator [Amycolatopsis nigrescens]|uniref:TetR/AcrR family transcriptional regulator n=1 Tax=Amycolatopsis nigrescens TaxID=381445 RepID=UPI00035F3DE2|nr:TetR/AcrR family transcriptional regulator [Amycolatopsis nigrescens]
MASSPLRVYGGVQGDHRQAERRAKLIEAGLDALGAESGAPPLSVRGVCKQSGLATRYFYESFADRDAFAVAVFDHVTQGLATTTEQAVAEATDVPGKIRAGVGNIIRTIADDPRQGRLLFSALLTSPVLARRRLESATMFAGLLGAHARDHQVAESDGPRLELSSQFIVGGFAQTLTAWLGGSVQLSRDELIDECTAIFVAIAGRPQ